MAACPLRYRLGAEALRRRAPRLRCETLYAVGGLYGNSFALRALVERALQEERPTQIVFNGDFNFLNATPAWWRQINTEIRDGSVRGIPHVATLGNVEAEAAAEVFEGCGCGYPSYTSPSVPERSDQIVRVLHGCAHAAGEPELLRWLRGLPLGIVAEVGPEGTPVAIVHGDVDSLAGWGLGVEVLEPLDTTLREQLGCGEQHVTPSERLQTWFREAGVTGILSTHTCLPFGQSLVEADSVFDEASGEGGGPLVLFNNGSAGMPNFRGVRAGLVTRVSADPVPPPDALYGVSAGGLRYDALPVYYDHEAFLARFDEVWPEGSAAAASYRERLLRGPAFSIEQAARGGVELAAGAAALSRELRRSSSRL